MNPFKTFIRFKHLYRKILRRPRSFSLFVSITAMFIKFILYQLLWFWLILLFFKIIYYNSLYMFHTSIAITFYIFLYIMISRYSKMDHNSRRKFYNDRLLIWEHELKKNAKPNFEKLRQYFPSNSEFEKFFQESLKLEYQQNRELIKLKMKMIITIVENCYCLIITLIIILLLEKFTLLSIILFIIFILTKLYIITK